MLATLTHTPFSDPDWLFERKLDGERLEMMSLSGEGNRRGSNRATISVSLAGSMAVPFKVMLVSVQVSFPSL